MMLPTDHKTRKGIPIFSAVVKFFPLALAALAEHSREENERHAGVGAPLTWVRSASPDHPDCIQRHLVDYACGDKKAMRAIMWRAAAQLQLDEEERLERDRINLKAFEMIRDTPPMTATEVIERRTAKAREVMAPLGYPFVCGACSQAFRTPQGLAAHISGRPECQTTLYRNSSTGVDRDFPKVG